MYKSCRKCLTEKPNTAFYKDCTRFDKLHPYCKSCHNRCPRTGINRRSVLLKNKYGITDKDFEQMKLRQGGLCAICQQSKNELVVDHCHKTKVVRGLLCRNCNLGLGSFKDTTQYLENAKEYLCLIR